MSEFFLQNQLGETHASLSVNCLADGSFSSLVGQLRACCKGPTKAAGVKLVDQNDGTYSLAIKAQEAGCHILSVTYAGVPIPG